MLTEAGLYSPTKKELWGSSRGLSSDASRYAPSRDVQVQAKIVSSYSLLPA